MFGNKASGRTYEVFKTKLAEKDGKVHVIIFNIFDKLFGAGTGIVKDYTKVDLLLSCIQDDGYEVMDVKLSSNEGSGGFTNGYCVLITYR